MRFLIILRQQSKPDARIKSACEMIEKKIQAMIDSNNYGTGVTECRYNLFFESIEFYKNYSREFYTPERLPKTLQEGIFETNCWVNDEQIVKIDERDIYRIICQEILKALYRLEKIEGFNYQTFYDDIIALFRREGWIYISFFMTGEIEATVGDKMDFFSSRSISGKLKSHISTNDYGQGVNHWGHIVICMTPDTYKAGFFKEIKKYTKKYGDVELRLRIDYESMLKADEQKVNKLICESFLRGIDIAENELKIKDFDFESFREDLNDLFKKEEWI